MSYEGDQSYGINTATGLLVSNIPTINIDNPTSKEANTVSVTFTSDKAGTYYYKYVAKVRKLRPSRQLQKVERLRQEKLLP